MNHAKPMISPHRAFRFDFASDACTRENDIRAAGRIFAVIECYTPSPSDAAGFINGEISRVSAGALCHLPWSADVDFGAK